MTFAEPQPHWYDWNFKIASLWGRPRNTYYSFLIWKGYSILNVDINLVFEIYTKLPAIWYIGLCIRNDECEHERPPSDIERSWRRDIHRWGEFILVYCFDIVVGVKEPNYSDVCLSLLHAGFQEKLCIWLMGYGLFVIDDWIVNDTLVVWDLCCLKTWGVRITYIIFICIYTWNAIIDDIDKIAMKWCWCLW